VTEEQYAVLRSGMIEATDNAYHARKFARRAMWLALIAAGLGAAALVVVLR
jgi:hypothetical protein